MWVQVIVELKTITVVQNEIILTSNIIQHRASRLGVAENHPLVIKF